MTALLLLYRQTSFVIFGDAELRGLMAPTATALSTPWAVSAICLSCLRIRQ